MSGIRIVAVIAILLGLAGLAYGQFSYTDSTHEAKIGPIDFSVKEKKNVDFPLWAGIETAAQERVVSVVQGTVPVAS